MFISEGMSIPSKACKACDAKYSCIFDKGCWTRGSSESLTSGDSRGVNNGVRASDHHADGRKVSQRYSSQTLAVGSNHVYLPYIVLRSRNNNHDSRAGQQRQTEFSIESSAATPCSVVRIGMSSLPE